MEILNQNHFKYWFINYQPHLPLRSYLWKKILSSQLQGYATLDEFKKMNSLGLMDLLSATALSHPLHRPRYSDQTWINQRALADPVLDKVTER